MKQSFFNYNLDTDYNIENFFVGSSNSYAYETLLNNQNQFKNFFLVGPNKSGKTHLGTIWKKKFHAKKFKNNINEIVKNKNNVYVEDIFNNFNEENIFHIINHCLLNNLKILITSNLDIANYNFILRDLSSRLKTFVQIKIDLPDDQLLINLMIKLFHDKQIIIKNPDILNYIIKRVDRSYEKIFILIDKIDKLLLTKNKQLTIPLIKELI